MHMQVVVEEAVFHAEALSASQPTSHRLLSLLGVLPLHLWRPTLHVLSKLAMLLVDSPLIAYGAAAGAPPAAGGFVSTAEILSPATKPDAAPLQLPSLAAPEAPAPPQPLSTAQLELALTPPGRPPPQRWVRRREVHR